MNGRAYNVMSFARSARAGMQPTVSLAIHISRRFQHRDSGRSAFPNFSPLFISLFDESSLVLYVAQKKKNYVSSL